MFQILLVFITMVEDVCRKKAFPNISKSYLLLLLLLSLLFIINIIDLSIIVKNCK
jgi:hypothetical protein